MVQQGADTYTDYVDADGNRHFLVKLGEIARVDSQPAINPGDESDVRSNVGGGFSNMVSVTQSGGPGYLNDKIRLGWGLYSSVENAGQPDEYYNLTRSDPEFHVHGVSGTVINAIFADFYYTFPNRHWANFDFWWGTDGGWQGRSYVWIDLSNLYMYGYWGSANHTTNERLTGFFVGAATPANAGTILGRWYDFPGYSRCVWIDTFDTVNHHVRLAVDNSVDGFSLAMTGVFF